MEVPAKRVVLGLYFEDYWAIGGDAAMDKLVGISKAAWSDWRPANWQAYLKVRPSLDQIPDVGEVEVSTFSVEKLIALKPDVAILAEWQVNGIGGDFQRIVDAGIPVVVVDYHAQTEERHVASTRLIGKVIGAEDRAEKIAQEYETSIKEVRDRIEKAGQPRPSVYIELGSKGPEEQGPSYGDYMWGKIAEVAGGDNITKDVVRTWGPVAPEQVLASRPEVVMMAGSEWRKHPTGQLMGEGVTAAEALERLKDFTQRPGWSSLPAIENGRLHAVYQGASRTIMDYTSVQYFAKALYPDLFKDIDPQSNYLAFYERYLPIRPSGTFMTGLK
ncbi:ABC transporter substrate-binding protein [Mesorhizobium sp. WSM2239]|uniref:ABC transporter substrate-binding protein n=2 Tax=unclassified Mesorhizobium TaxID=325217 RepID=A0AAU8DGQ8_9HYPH